MTTALPATRDSGSTGICRRRVDAGSQRPGDGDGRSPSRRATFPALGVRLVQGRLLHEQDDERAPRAAVINETLAKTYFRGEDPDRAAVSLRQRPRSGPTQRTARSPSSGSSRDVKEDAIDAPVRPQIYRSLLQIVDAVAGGGGERPGCTAVRRGGAAGGAVGRSEPADLCGAQRRRARRRAARAAPLRDAA